jgi:G3E family GTPase
VIPFTVIGGFLGAGKTTLLNQLLRDAGERRLAVLVNDFGALNIDAALVQARAGAMVRLENGCVCCSVGGDFIAALALLRDGPDPPEHVVVEASGVADPGAIVVLGDMPGYRRDAAVVVADAETVRARAEHEATRHQVIGQLRAADLLVLNKTDLVSRAALEATRAWLRAGRPLDGDRRRHVRRDPRGGRARRGARRRPPRGRRRARDPRPCPPVLRDVELER